MIHGNPDSGKGIVLRLLAGRLKKLPDITVGAINHPQSNLADFYREFGDTCCPPAPLQSLGRLQGVVRALAQPSRIESLPRCRSSTKPRK
ncbi:hypothetical protein TPL01_32650 [Sulfuriferula plumbiphila]|uniref:Uncharacterized protein n=1 Tax=Sulfuriferula plumbiphila TaxID=171865 RepID=A0A512LCA6_9PROT|nr:hypothetical protein SFPGR_21850 [Sulfuriferula plumbiphila]GEP32127.1 hypothetical protein TPL01_32650 [Sulfuriferula plumbiphila]